MENSKSKASNTGYKGVYFRKDHGVFVSMLNYKHDTIKLHIGSYETLKEAIKAREEFIKSLF